MRELRDASALLDKKRQPQASVLIVEDERIIAMDISLRLESLGYRTAGIVGKGDAAVSASRQLQPDLILMDIRLAGEMDGIEVARQIRETRAVPIVFLTAHADKTTLQRAVNASPYGYLLKPITTRELQVALENAFVRWRLEEQLWESEARYRNFVEQFQGIAFRGDLNLHPQFIHGAVEAITGYTEADFLEGLNWGALTHPDDQAVFTQLTKRLREEAGNALQHEYRIIRRDGTLRWLHVRFANLPGASGAPEIIQGSMYDITTRVLADQASQRRLKELEVLNQVAVAGSRAADEDWLVAGVTEIIANTFYPDHCGVLLFDENAAKLRTHPSYHGVLDEERRSFSLGEGIVGRVAQSRQAIQLQDVSQEPAFIASGSGTLSELCVPMLAGERLLGVINVESKQASAFSEDDLRLLQTVAGQLATAMTKIRSLQEARQRAEWQAALNDLITAAIQADDLPALLEDVLTQVQRAFHHDARCIWYRQHRRIAGLPAGSRAILVQLLEEHGAAFEQRLIVNDWGADLPESALSQVAPQVLEMGVRATLLVPLRANGAHVGGLGVGSAQPHHWTAGEISLLQAMGRQVESAAARLELHRQTTQRLERLSSLHRIETALSATMDLQAMFNMLAGEIVRQPDVDAAAILLLEPTTLTLKYASGRNLPQRALESRSLRVGEGLAGRAAFERQMLVRPDLTLLEDLPPRANLFLAEGFRAYVAVPLIAKGRVKGVLELLNHAPTPVDAEREEYLLTLAAQVAIAIENITIYQEMQRANLDIHMAFDATIEGWARTLELRASESVGHHQRTAEQCLDVGRLMGVAPEKLAHMQRGALLHDIGLLAVPESILLKPAPLDDAEWALVKKHPLFAYELLSSIAHLHPVLEIPYGHHERWDGSGYPLGLSGDQIPLAARIFAVVDVWDALTHARPYRGAWPEEKARAYISAQAGKLFDPRVVEHFLKYLDQRVR